ncbi:hypothetical protein [Pseudomonas sediminis]|uniref:Uncharacterized protein n=1 Tax=Pseudomonas sediminis TaxID=1691904 RepID=A0A2G5FIE9_9PSED|nr:hypothetical protein [Pseudomonas sediminis]PIA67757.1 hypothetical protein CDO35_16205 [Pseudomonas sediminis]
MRLSLRRRAIYTGLAGHFSDEEVWPLLALWENKYAEQPPFALNGFLAEVVLRTERKLERARLYRELVGALTGPPSQLLPDPEEQLAAWRQGRNEAVRQVATPDSAAQTTFLALNQALLEQLDGTQQAALRRFAAGNLSGMGVSSELSTRLRIWLEQGGGDGIANLGLEQLRKLLNLLYIGLCEFLGPVRADRVLSQAVNRVEGQGVEFSPRRLL